MKTNEIVDLDEAERMRKAGASYAEIAARFGVSHQAVQQKMVYHKRKRRRYQDIFAQCPYIGLREYMLSHKGMTIAGLCRILFSGDTNALREKTRRLLGGSDTLLQISAIQKLVAATGMSFAELFRRETDV